jgi:hypothetical protein
VRICGEAAAGLALVHRAISALAAPAIQVAVEGLECADALTR